MIRIVVFHRERNSEIYVPFFYNYQKLLKGLNYKREENVTFLKVISMGLQRKGMVFYKEW